MNFICRTSRAYPFIGLACLAVLSKLTLGIDAAFAQAEQVIEAAYRTDPAYHAQMEPMNATASVSEDGKSAEIWVSTQTQSLTVMGAAEALGTTIDKITLHPIFIGGG